MKKRNGYAAIAGVVAIILLPEKVCAKEYQTYTEYRTTYRDEIYSGETVQCDMNEIPAEERTASTAQSAVLNFEVEKTGLYVLGFDYKCTGDNILQTSLTMKVNGEIPYRELEHLFFSDTWRTGEKEYDRYGNESIAMPDKVKEWKFTYLRDTSFLQNDPLMVYLEAGENELEFTANEGCVELGDIYLSAPVQPAEDCMETADGEAMILIEAEDFVTRNSPNIRTIANFNTRVTPYDPELKRQNVIDEASFRIGGTSVDYQFTVDEAGYYYIAFDYLQSSKSNFTVYRNLYIDGEIPSKSYENIPFEYTTGYSRNKQEIPVYLSQGTHELTLEVALEPYGEAVSILNGIVEQINDLALSVNKITGGNINKYRDFELEQYGLNIEGNLNSWADTVETLYEELAAMDRYGKKNGEIKLLDTAVKSLRLLAEKPNELPQNIDTFSYGDSSVRQYLTTVAENLSYGNLSLDKLFIYQKDADLPKAPGFFARMGLSLKHFVASFTQSDYAPGYAESDTLEIWVNRPRQYLEIIQRMADTDFTEKTGIKVNLSIVPDQQKLILSNASGKAPDGAIGIASGYVYDLALRNALVDLRQFENFSRVGKRFAPGMLIPGVCDDGIYAIPETFNFYVMFYRTDIFEKLNLKVPDNMEEVRELLPELTRMGLGFNTHVANMPTKTFAATAPFVFQNGGDIFGDTTTKVQLDTEEVIGGLKYLTENFTVYDMDYEILNFYQSFRDGRTPIGVSDYATYNLLTNAAPELNGCWEIALYPGLVAEDGTVDRSTSGAAESCILFQSSDKQEAAWKFIDWWMSDEVQTEFSFTLQTTLGNEYMWNSANLSAIGNAPWSEKNKQVILEQIGWTNEMPRVPGSYMIERELGNVLINVVTNNQNIRTAIDNAQKRINSELQRKLEEFGYIDSEGNVKKELIAPNKELIEEWLE
ncbi:MAG: extracellular solute-binding protein [Acetatifactor sp.]|nr:extracellular solute-binding protein [Acetatifactor sp.]